MTDKLTPAAARNAPVGSILHDHEVTGLRLRVTRTRRSWYLYYRTRAGDQRQPKLGDFPEMSLSRAREVARDLKDRIARGEDPAATWRGLREAPTVADLCERYLKEHAAKRKAARSAKEDAKLIRAHVLPGLGRLRVAEVRKPDVDRFLDDVEARRFVDPTPRHKGKRTAPGAANRCRALLSKMMTLAITDYDMRPHGAGNPVAGTVPRTIAKRRRVATPAELRALAGELRALFVTHPRHAAALAVLFATGARVGEIERARVRSFTGRELILSEHKTFKTIGEKVVPLPPGAVALIHQVAPPASAGPDARLFGDIQLRSVWQAIRDRVGCPDLQMRDARRTFASYALSDGASLDQIGDLFGHTDTRTTKGYAGLLQDARRKVAATGAAAVSRAAGGLFDQPGASGAPERRRVLWRPAGPSTRGRLALRPRKP